MGTVESSASLAVGAFGGLAERRTNRGGSTSMQQLSLTVYQSSREMSIS
jgi:hypothetical protein